MKVFQKVLPILVALVFISAIGYPTAYWIGLTKAWSDMQDRSRWIQGSVVPAAPVDLSNPNQLSFHRDISAPGVLTIDGQPLPLSTIIGKDVEQNIVYTNLGEHPDLPLLIPAPLEGEIDGQNHVFKTTDDLTGKPLYLNGRLLNMFFERPEEKPDNVITEFNFSSPHGVFVLNGTLLVEGEDYQLDGNTLIMSEPVPLWTSGQEPDWGRPLRIVGDYAWADAQTIVLREPPPVGSQLQLASSFLGWVQQLDGPVDGFNRTFHFALSELVPSDRDRAIYVNDQLLSNTGARLRNVNDDELHFGLPKPDGIIVREERINRELTQTQLVPDVDYTIEGDVLTLNTALERGQSLRQYDYLVLDSQFSRIVLAKAPEPGSVVWTSQYKVYLFPSCGLTVFECFDNLPQHPVPLPHWIIESLPDFFTNNPEVFGQIGYTTFGSLAALLMGGAVGLVLAALFVLIRPLERAFLPWVVASQTVPIIALVPVLILILSQFGITIQTSILPTAIIGGYLSFFPITIGTAKGLRSVDPLSIDLMHSYAANKWQIFFKVRFYAALPFVFASFKIGAAAALVGALISETETSNASGLGFAILGRVQAGNVADLWILFLISVLMGILFVSAVGWVERLLAPWMRKV